MQDALIVGGFMVVIYMLTQGIKTIVDVAMGKDDKGVPKRRKNVWLNRVVFPAIPPVLGLALAFVPLRPTFLIEYVAEHFTGFDEYLAYMAYGAVVGQFSDYGYTKVKSFIEDFKAPKP